MKFCRVCVFFFAVCLLPVFGHAVDLKCSYLHDIQDKYLDLHISFSNFDRKKKKQKAFRQKMAKLETRVKEQFIKSLDSEKLYFTQSDINNIKKQMKNIFKKIKEENCSDLNRIYTLYNKRVLERVKFAHDYLNETFILEPGVRITLDPRKRKRSRTLRQINNFHKKYIQYQMANAVIASDKEQYKDQVVEAKQNILRSYSRLKKEVKSWSVHLSEEEKKKCYNKRKSSGDVVICKPDKWYTFYLNSFAKGFDPHSGYLSRQAHEDFEINMRLSLEGIGASLSSRYGHTVIERLVPGGSADRSGKIKPKDKILAVGQKAKKMINIFDMNIRDVVNMIRGRKGTPVYLKIMRTNKKGKTKKTKIFTVRLIRDRVHLKDQAADIYYFDQKRNGRTHKVAVLTVPSFYGAGRRSGGRSVTKDVKRLLLKARRKKVSALVLDMSSNGGGSLTEAVRVAGLFFAKGSVVRQLVKTKNGDRYLTLSDVDDKIIYSGPLVVLINRVSASASEIVSGTLKSYKRAVIVGGDHTFGKGSIQSVERLRMGLGSIRVTVGLFFVPNGFSTQLKGVASDIVFPNIFSNEEIGEKNLDYFLPERKIPNFISSSAYKSKRGRKWNPVSDQLISFLKKNSLKRIKENKKFQEIGKDIMEIKNKRQTGYATTIAEIFDQAKKEEQTAEKKAKEVESRRRIRMVRTRKARKKYMAQRADIEEAMNIALDQVEWESRTRIAQMEK